MKKVLITGAGSFIGVRLEQWLLRTPERYHVDTLDMIGDGWRSADFSGYDAVFHVAGLAHVDISKADAQTVDRYYRVNTDLAVETAKKAKADGVGQFLFMSSASVYGESTPTGQEKHITAETKPAPADCYGGSKYKAEEGIAALESDSFRVAILRPPMIYGKGCRGNYPTLSSLARKLPLFPKIENRRSMLYIDNFTEFVRLLIDNRDSGVFHPQNAEYSNTSQMVRLIALAHGKKMSLIGGCAWMLKLLGKVTPKANKAFGSFTYDQSLSAYPQNYCLYTLEASIRLTEE